MLSTSSYPTILLATTFVSASKSIYKVKSFLSTHSSFDEVGGISYKRENKVF